MASRRPIRSSSQGEIGMFTRTMTIESPTLILERPRPIYSALKRAPNMVKELKPMPQPKMAVPIKQQPPKKTIIFTFGSPEREKETKIDEGFGVFLQNCNLCKKKLKPDAEIYMYGYLGAFCSSECRDDRMALDGLSRLVVPKASTHKLSSKRF